MRSAYDPLFGAGFAVGPLGDAAAVGFDEFDEALPEPGLELGVSSEAAIRDARGLEADDVGCGL